MMYSVTTKLQFADTVFYELRRRRRSVICSEKSCHALNSIEESVKFRLLMKCIIPHTGIHNGVLVSNVNIQSDESDTN